MGRPSEATNLEQDSEIARVKAILDRLNNLAAYSGKGKVVDAETYLAQQRESEADAQPYHLQDYPELDSLVAGFKPGEVVAVTGLFGQGKTLLIRSIVRDFASQGIPCAIFSYEVAPAEFLKPLEAAQC